MELRLGVRSVNDNIVNHLIYADDIVVFCPSLSGLQHLVNTSHTFIPKRRLLLNTNKTKCVKFQAGRTVANPQSSISIDGVNLDFVNEYKYLGFLLTNNI